jgi:dTMP kinase
MEYGSGFLVSLVGISGSGKSTLAGLLDVPLSQAGLTSVAIKPPLFDNPAYERYGRLFEKYVPHVYGEVAGARASLVLLEMCHFVVTVVEPALERFDVVVTERYLESAGWYLAARSLPSGDYDRFTRKLKQPHLTIILDTPVPVARRRLVALGEAVSRDRLGLLTRLYRAQTSVDAAEALVVDGSQGVDQVLEEVAAGIISSIRRLHEGREP